MHGTRSGIESIEVETRVTVVAGGGEGVLYFVI